MSTTMDENTVTANLVTFINCLSLPERKFITGYLFGKNCFKEHDKPNEDIINENISIIKNTKDLKWQISYHTSVYEGCQPDITIDLEKTRLFIEVKTRLNTGFTPSECKGGLREVHIKPENHLYLLPEAYDVESKIENAPVCYWKELKNLLEDSQINCTKFFNEIGKYIENFIFNTKTLTTGELSMIYEPIYIHQTFQLMTKMNNLISDCDAEIISRLNKLSDNKFSPSDFFGYGKGINSAKWINYNGKTSLGYGIYDLFDQVQDIKKQDLSQFVFCIWMEKDLINPKGIEGKDFVINNFGYVFYPLDRKVLAIDNYDEMKESFINTVVNKINGIFYR